MKKIFKIILVIIICAFIYSLGKASNSSELIESSEPTINETIKDNEVEIKQEDSYDVVESLVTPEFKELMDNYEAFFDEYIAFMDNYDENNLDLMYDYLNYLEKFANTMDKLSEIDENELSEADTLYYLEVTTRIYAKLEKAAY